MNLDGKTVVITGATGGIGKILVKLLDSAGAKTILVSRNENDLHDLQSSLSNKESAYFSCDLSNQSDTVKTAELIASKYPQIDILINCAGIGIYKPIEDATLNDFNDSINIGLNINIHFY